MWAISTLGVVLATVGMLWCSATQNRTNPSRSAACAKRVVSAKASAEEWPAPTTAKSSTDNATIHPTYGDLSGYGAGMAIAKVCGIETEYGIVVRGGDSNPVSASSLLINAYVNATSRKIGWDFEDETPANDARGFNLDDVFAPEIETSLVNAVLPNGARYYVDHAHPEISTPEVTTAAEAVLWDRAADEIVRASMGYAQALLAPDAELVVYKNNSDGKGNSYGCHENYLVSRDTPFGRIVSQVTPHFVTRQVFCGAGKVGCEQPGREPTDVAYQLSQRADFFEEEVGLETTLKRPIVNTRDEPHCDPQKYRRLHVIVGDANISEVSTYLKVGTSAIVLAMIEDNELGDEWLLASPVLGDPPGQPRSLVATHDHDARRASGDRHRDSVGVAGTSPQVRADAWLAGRWRDGWRRCVGALGTGAGRTRIRPDQRRRMGRLGGQAASRRRLRRSSRRRAGLGATQGDRPAVSRHARRAQPGGRAGLATIVGPDA